MNKITKRLSICILSGTLMFAPVALGAEDYSIVSEAHSGRTDSNGGHKDNKNKSGLGSYHYHCGGHPAHLHDGGVCPYGGTATSSAAASGITSSEVTSTSTPSSSVSSGVKTVTLHDNSTISLSTDILKLVQDVLNEKGYDCGKADGIVGEKTKTAISKYLKDNTDDSSDRMIIEMIAEALDIE